MNLRISFLLFFTALLLVASCKNSSNTLGDVSFDSYKVADGFELQLAAAEPLIEAPIAMDFDNQGRMWVVEMRGFMPNLAGTGDDAPVGRISILEDADKDGEAEHAKIFLDSLVLPRGLAHAYGGLLYIEPPFLWFVEIDGDKPGKKTLVDSTYADGGSPEAQANGLMMNIDNWIYSANSQFKYQLKNGKWLKEPTSFRGQFGITRDDFGRLYYNYNEIQIAGDYVLPNALIGNPYYKPKEGINKLLTENQRVYPLHATTVNRGYAQGILDKDSMLANVTAACGPLLYRGDHFPDEYYQNAFACEPQANLVKRNMVTFEDDKTTAKQAYENKEFIASTDEGFRPVNLFNGPDGAMYIVDMHRGVMEYRAFATPYYNNGIAGKKLDTLLNAGRILRVKYKGKDLTPMPNLANNSVNELLSLLKSKNGWIRDRAHQLIVYKQDKSVVPTLQQMALDTTNEIAATHALHILNGIDALSFALIEQIAAKGEPKLTAHCLQLLEKYATSENVTAMFALADNLYSKNNNVINLYLANSLGPWVAVAKAQFLPLLAKLAQAYPEKALYQEAVISSLKGVEQNFQSLVANSEQPKSYLLDSLLTLTLQNKQDNKMNPIYVQVKAPKDARTNGLALFRTTCSACHGPDGDGIENVAPPLKGSEYVDGSSSRLTMIILNGLEGPIHLNGKLQHFNGTMPNFANNYSDKDIADIVRYLHNAYATKSVKSISAEKVKELRGKKTGTLKEKDLIEMANLE